MIKYGIKLDYLFADKPLLCYNDAVERKGEYNYEKPVCEVEEIKR